MNDIIFGITNLEIGGAEKVLIDIVNRLHKENYNIKILTLYSNSSLEKELHPDIKLVSVLKFKENMITKKIMGLILRIKFARNYLYNKYVRGKCKTAVSFLEGPMTKLFAQNSNEKKIAWVHTNLFEHYKNKDIKKIKEQYDKYEKIVFCSNEALNGFNELINTKTEKVVIHNYLDTINIIKKSSEIIEEDFINNIPTFLSVGRLVKAKGYDRLINVSKMLINKNYMHKIYIIGDGEEYSNLDRIIKEKGMSAYIKLLGKKDNPYPYMKKINTFILPSYYEGYGMVLIEAMTLNKDIIITKTGAIEAIDGYNHKLIAENNEEGIYDAMKKIINKEIIFPDNINIKYDTEKIFGQIKSIL